MFMAGSLEGVRHEGHQLGPVAGEQRDRVLVVRPAAPAPVAEGADDGHLIQPDAARDDLLRDRVDAEQQHRAARVR
jgi:hypothetical protein